MTEQPASVPLNWTPDPASAPAQIALLNGWWQFQPFAPESPSGAIPETFSEQILVPTFWNSLPEAWAGDWDAYRNFNWPREWDKARTAAYRREIALGPQPAHHRLRLEFDAVLARARVSVNGVTVLTIEDGFLPHDCDITNAVRWDATNTIELLVTERPKTDGENLLRPGGSWIGWFLLGIWQDVRLRLVPDVRLADIFVQPSVRAGSLRVTATVANDSPTQVTVRTSHTVRGEAITVHSDAVDLAPGESREVHGVADWPSPRLWSPEDPHLYLLDSALTVADSSASACTCVTRFGFKEFWLDGTSFILNGHKIRFRGDSWHYMGAAEQSPEYARTWFEFAKATGANAIRLHALPHPRFFCEIADEVGLCIIDECAVYGSAGNLALDSDEFWRHARDHVRRLVLRDRNHPSVCLWSASNEVIWKGGPAAFAPLLSLEDAILKVDNTRPVSFDENKSDLGGGARIMGGHYGSNDEWHRSWKRDRPLMVNEFGCLYYSGPEEPARWGGEPCFADFSARLLGGAAEAREMILGLRAMGAASLTPWNFVWYTLWPAFPPEPVILEPDPTAPGIKTQRIGQHSLSINYEIVPGRRLDPDGPKWLPHAAHAPMKDAYAPVAAFWRQPRHCAFVSEVLKAICDLHNDSLREQTLSIQVLLADAVAFASQHTLAPGTSAAIEVAIAVPTALASRAVDLGLVTLSDGVEIHRDTARLWISPHPEAITCPVAVCDPAEVLRSALSSLGASPEPWTPSADLNPPTASILVLGPGALPDTTLRDTVTRLQAHHFFSQGGRLIAWGNAFKPDTSSHVNPVEREFASSWRRAMPDFWHSLPPDEFFSRWDRDEASPYANGAVAHAAFPKPAQGNHAPLAEVADGGAGLEYSPLLWHPVDAGGVTLCSYAAAPLARRHPAPLTLLRRLIEYAPLGPPSCTASLAHLPPNSDLARVIRRTGIIESADSPTLHIIDGATLATTGAPGLQIIQEVTAAGGTVVLINLTPDGASAVSKILGVPINLQHDDVENVAKSPACEMDPLLEGLSHDDFVWVRRGQAEPIVDYTIEPADGLRALVQTVATRWKGYAEAAEQHKYALMLRRLRAFAGPRIALADVSVGSGRVIICQLRLAGAKIFRRKAGRIMTHVLRNLGARFSDDSSPLLARRSPFTDENGYVRRWLLLGVYKPQKLQDIMDEDYVGGEPALQPALNAEVTGRRWFAHESGEPDINLRAAFEGQLLDNVAVYAGIYVFSPTARDILLDTPDMVNLAIGCEDSVHAWLNAELILHTDSQRSYETDQDIVHGVKLRRGWNRLVLKLMQRSWDWRMSVRFLSSRGQVVEDLEYAFVPGETGI